MRTTYIATQKQLGRNLRALRLAADLSQMGLSDLSDVDFTMISKIERGVTNPSLFTLFRLADALKISLKELLS